MIYWKSTVDCGDGEMLDFRNSDEENGERKNGI